MQIDGGGAKRMNDCRPGENRGSAMRSLNPRPAKSKKYDGWSEPAASISASHTLELTFSVAAGRLPVGRGMGSATEHPGGNKADSDGLVWGAHAARILVKVLCDRVNLQPSGSVFRSASFNLPTVDSEGSFFASLD